MTAGLSLFNLTKKKSIKVMRSTDVRTYSMHPTVEPSSYVPHKPPPSMISKRTQKLFIITDSS